MLLTAVGSDSDSGFLQVQSTEAAMRNDPNEFPYSVQDAAVARNLSGRGSIAHSMPYPHDLPHVGSSEMLTGNPYRGGSTYSYAKPSYYSAMPGYPMGYVDEYTDYPSMANSSQHVMGHDMVPYSTWTSRDYGYGGTASLVHRPAPSVASDSANFSFHSMAAHLPASSASVSDRLLPAPSSRSMSYTGSHSYRALPPAGGADPSPVHAAAVLADMASGTYANSFDTSGLPYSSSAAVSLQTHAGSDHHSSRTNSESYSPDTESIFTEHEQSLRSQGSAVDLNVYTYSGTDSGPSSLRRGSAASGCPTLVSSSSGSGSGSGSGGTCNSSKGASSTASSQSSMADSHHSQQQQHIYVPANSIQGSTPSHHSHHHQLPLVATTGGPSAVSGGTASATSYLADSNASSPSGTGCGHAHADTRRATVGGRR
jgi:hypothetical protein